MRAASRARDIWGPGLPLPLRNTEMPWGLPTDQMSEQDHKRVESPHRLYRNALSILRYCQAKDIAWSLNSQDTLGYGG